MADNIDVGQGIALQTRAVPYRGTPITTGLRLNQATQLKEQEIEAKKERARQKRKDALNKMMTINPIAGIHPRYQQRVFEVGQKGIEDINDPDLGGYDKGLSKFNTEQELQNIHTKSERLNSFVKHASNKNNLVYPGFLEASQASSAEKGNELLDKITPSGRVLGAATGTIVDDSDGNDMIPEVTMSFTRMRDLPNYPVKILAEATKESEYNLQNKMGNFQQISQSLTPRRIDQLATNAVNNNPEFAANLIVQNSTKAEELFDKQPADLTDEQKVENVQTQLAKDLFRDTYHKKLGLRWDAIGGGEGQGVYNTKDFTFSITEDAPAPNAVNVQDYMDARQRIAGAMRAAGHDPTPNQIDESLAQQGFVPALTTIKGNFSNKSTTSQNEPIVIKDKEGNDVKVRPDEFILNFDPRTGKFVDGTIVGNFEFGNGFVEKQEIPIDKELNNKLTAYFRGYSINNILQKTGKKQRLPVDWNSNVAKTNTQGTGSNSYQKQKKVISGF